MYNGTFKVSGTIDLNSYISISRFLLSPGYKIAWWIVTAVINSGFIALVLIQLDLDWLLWVALVTAVSVWLYRKNLKVILGRVLGSLKDLRDGEKYKFYIDFEPDAVRIHNRTTQSDTALAYEVFSAYADTPKVIIFFVKTGTYLLVPKDKLTESDKQALLSLMKERCSGLHKRRF